jgi:hypothetical protein
MILLFLILIVEMLFSTNGKYIVIVVNKSKMPIYFNGSFDLRSYGIYNNEKIHHVSLTVDYDPNMFNIYKGNPIFNISSKIRKQSIKILRKNGDINNYNHLYKDRTEFVSDIHFVFFFTRQPYAIKTYDEYIEIMKKNGYAVTGKLVKNILFFTFSDTELQVDENAINDLLNFVRRVKAHAEARE